MSDIIFPVWMVTAALVTAVVVARAFGVMLGTVRIVLLIDGYRKSAAAIGFVETLVWVVTTGFVLLRLDQPIYAVGYAAAYGLGVLAGATVQRRLALGDVVLRVITAIESPSPALALRDAGFGVTVLNGDGMGGPVRMALSVVPRRQLADAMALIQDSNPDAFVTRDAVVVPEVSPAARRGLLRRR